MTDNETKSSPTNASPKPTWVHFDEENVRKAESKENVDEPSVPLTTVPALPKPEKAPKPKESPRKAVERSEPKSQQSSPNKPTTWVQFEEENGVVSSTNSNSVISNAESPAVITTESVHVNPERINTSASTNKNNSKQLSVNKLQQLPPSGAASVNNASVSVSLNVSKHGGNGGHVENNSHPVVVDPAPALRTVELNSGIIRQGFANGDIVVTLLPVNTKWPWITPAQFRPELVPEELMAQGLTLTVEEYVQALELLVNDTRFTLYNVCYKRVLVCWILFAFLVLVGLLFSGLTGLPLFSLGVVWLLLNAAAIFLCMWLKMRLSRGLERCMARVNKQLLRHKLAVALDDRGRISCHKVNLCFMYLDAGPCIAHLQGVIEREEAAGGTGAAGATGWESRMDVTASDIVIQGSSTTRLSRKQDLAEQALLRYLQRWGKDYLRRRLDWTLDEDGGNPVSPRHMTPALCPCQYVEELIRNKVRKDPRVFCPCCTNWLAQRGID